MNIDKESGLIYHIHIVSADIMYFNWAVLFFFFLSGLYYK